MPRELPLPYVPIDPLLEESVRFHDFVEAADLWDDDHAVLYIHLLIVFAGKCRVDGNLGKVSARQLARECRFRGDPDLFLRALLKSQWLLEHPGGYRIEGWDRHGGRVLEKRKQYRERKQRQRGGHADVPRDTSGTDACVHPVKGEGEGEGEGEENRNQATTVLYEQPRGENDAPETASEGKAGVISGAQLLEMVGRWNWGKESWLIQEDAEKACGGKTFELQRVLAARKACESAGGTTMSLGFLLAKYKRVAPTGADGRAQGPPRSAPRDDSERHSGDYRSGLAVCKQRIGA